MTSLVGVTLKMFLPTFRVPGVERTQKFPKLAIWVLFKKRVSFAVKGTEVN